MSEYITLASNIKGIQYNESNYIAQFRTRLGKKINFDGEWVVGLSDITYTKSWYNVLASHKIILYDQLGHTYGIHSTVNDEEFTISAGFYESAQKLINEINRILIQFTDIKPAKLLYNELNNCITVIPGTTDEIKIYPYLGEEIEMILGLKKRFDDYNMYSTNTTENELIQYVFKNTDNFLYDKLEAYHPVEIAGGFHSLFLYSDIVYPSFVGDTCANIIRVVEVPRKYKFGETVHINYDTPHYRKLMLNEFESIELSIRDHSGGLIPFKFGVLSVTLHFKKL